MPERPKLRGGLVFPSLLIGLGVLLLLDSLELLGPETWDAIVNLWPVLLIAIGLDLVLGRRSAARSAMVALATLGIVATGVWTSEAWLGGAAITSETISQPAAAAARANVEIAMGVGTLRVGALGEGDQLVAGTIAHPQRDRVTSNFSLSGDTAFYRLRGDERGNRFPVVSRNNDQVVWDLRLSQQLPMQLKISTGVGNATLDLARLRVDDLRVDTGVGTTTLTLPRAGHVLAVVHGGVGNTTIIIPANVAARIEASAGLGGTSVAGDYRMRGSAYVSPGYDTADNRVELIVTGGIGGISIQQGSGR